MGSYREVLFLQLGRPETVKLLIDLLTHKIINCPSRKPGFQAYICAKIPGQHK
jgi:hypothetical protein